MYAKQTREVDLKKPTNQPTPSPQKNQKPPQNNNNKKLTKNPLSLETGTHPPPPPQPTTTRGGRREPHLNELSMTHLFSVELKS